MPLLRVADAPRAHEPIETSLAHCVGGHLAPDDLVTVNEVVLD